VVYSTCSISPLENDQVVSKAIALLQDQMHISISSYPQQMLKEPIKLPLEPIKLPSEPFRASASLAELLHQVGAEPTKHGIIVLPDKAGMWRLTVLVPGNPHRNVLVWNCITATGCIICRAHGHSMSAIRVLAMTAIKVDILP